MIDRYDRVEVILHKENDGDESGLWFTDEVFKRSEDFDWWYDHKGEFHVQFLTLSSTIVGTSLLIDSIIEA